MQNRLQAGYRILRRCPQARNRFLSQVHYRRALAYRQLGDSEHAEAAMTQFRRLKNLRR